MAKLISNECPAVITELQTNNGVIGIFTDRKVFAAALMTCIQMYQDDGHSLCSVLILAANKEGVGSEDDIDFYTDCNKRSPFSKSTENEVGSIDIIKEIANVFDRVENRRIKSPQDDIDMFVIELVYGNPDQSDFRKNATRILRAEAHIVNRLIGEALT